MNTRIDYLADHQRTVPVLAQWLFEEWGHCYPDTSVDTMASQLRARMHRDRSPLALVAFEAGEPIGTASLKIREVEIRPQYEHWLGSLFVAEPYRGRGIGSKLITAIKAEADKLGIDELYLYTRQAATARLYKKLGWIEIEQANYRSRPALIMKAILN